MTRKEIYEELLKQKRELAFGEKKLSEMCKSIDIFDMFDIKVKQYATEPKLIEITALGKNSRPLIWIDLFPISELIVSGYLIENSQNNDNKSKNIRAFRAGIKTYVSMLPNLPNFIGVYNPEDIMVGALHRKSNYKKKTYDYWLISNDIEYKGYI